MVKLSEIKVCIGTVVYMYIYMYVVIVIARLVTASIGHLPDADFKYRVPSV